MFYQYGDSYPALIVIYFDGLLKGMNLSTSKKWRATSIELSGDIFLPDMTALCAIPLLKTIALSVVGLRFAHNINFISGYPYEDLICAYIPTMVLSNMKCLDKAALP